LYLLEQDRSGEAWLAKAEILGRVGKSNL
jgi:hypothetical protein